MKRESPPSDPATTIAIRIGLALVFVLTGVDKIATASQPHWVHVFDQIGIGQWFRYATASIEIIGGLLCLVPLTTTLGAAMLACTMVGAMSVHVFIFHHPADALFPGAYLVGVILGYLKLRPRS